MLQIERIATLSEFKNVADEWNQILAASGSDNIHLTHEWLLTWAATLGKGRELLILKIKDNNETIGFAPLMIRTIRLRRLIPYRQIVFLGDPESDFADVIITRNRSEVIQSLLNYLSENQRWGEILLHTIPELSPNFSVFQSVLSASTFSYEFTPHTKCYFIPVREKVWDEFYKTTSKGFVQKDIQRLLNHYSKLSWEINDWTAGDSSSLIPVITMLHHLSQLRKGRRSSYYQNEFKVFIEKVIKELSKKGWIKIYILKVGGEPASFVFGFVYNQVYYYWNIGFDTALERLSPSKFLLYNILKKGFENRIWDEFNFMRGDTDYKRRWASLSYNLYQLRILNTKGFYGKINRLRRKTNIK